MNQPFTEDKINSIKLLNVKENKLLIEIPKLFLLKPRILLLSFFILINFGNSASADLNNFSYQNNSVLAKECERNPEGDLCKRAQKAELAKIEKELNGNSKENCDRARANLKEIEREIQSNDSCPGGLSISTCMEKAKECNDEATIDSDDSTGGFLGALAPALGGVMSGSSGMNMFPMFGSGSAGGAAKNKCQQTRSDWETMKEHQEKLREQMNDAQDKINDRLENAQENLTEAQRNQKESLDNMADLVMEYRTGKQTSKDQMSSKQLQFNNDMRKKVLEIQALNSQIMLDEKAITLKTMDQQNLSVQYIDECSNMISDEKEKALIALETTKSQMEETLFSISDIQEREQKKQYMSQKLNEAKSKSENILTQRYDKCMKDKNKAYKDAFKKLGFEIESNKHQLDLNKTKLAHLQAELQDIYKQMTLEIQSIAEQADAQLDNQENKLNNMQNAIYNEAQNVMTQNQQIQDLQKQSQQQNLMNMLTNGGAISMFGMNAGMSSGTESSYMGLGSATGYYEAYELAKEEIAENCKGQTSSSGKSNFGGK